MQNLKKNGFPKCLCHLFPMSPFCTRRQGGECLHVLPPLKTACSALTPQGHSVHQLFWAYMVIPLYSPVFFDLPCWIVDMMVTSAALPLYACFPHRLWPEWFACRKGGFSVPLCCLVEKMMGKGGLGCNVLVWFSLRNWRETEWAE